MTQFVQITVDAANLETFIDELVDRKVREAVSDLLARPLGSVISAETLGAPPQRVSPKFIPAPPPAPARIAHSKSEAKRKTAQTGIAHVVQGDDYKGALIAVLRNAGGELGAGELLKSLGWAKPRYHAVLKGLKADKSITVIGQKRATRYALNRAKANGAVEHAAN